MMPAMVTDNLGNEREAQTFAGCPGGDKGFKQVRHQIGWDAGPAVLNHEFLAAGSPYQARTGQPTFECLGDMM